MAQKTKSNTSNHHSHSSSHHSPSHHSSHSSSHHSSHGSKSRHKKHDEHGKLRMVFAFLLFLSISAVAVLSGIKVTVLNKTQIADIFTNREYTYALYEDVLEYSQDMCLKYGIPDESVKQEINFSSINEIQTAYSRGVLNIDEMYSETAYLDLVSKLNKDLVLSTKSMISENKLSVAENQKNDGAQKFADEITSYLIDKVEFEYTAELQSVINVSSTALSIAIVFFAILSVAFLLLVISLADKKYRALRTVCYSVFSASALNLILVLFVGIVDIFKDLVIYPSYLCDSVIRYVNSCVLTYLLEALFLFVIGVMISAFVWKLKRSNE